MAKVTGIGGVFIKSKNDGPALAKWYQKHLGIKLEDFGGAILNWPEDKAEDKGMTVWTTADTASQWFSPSESSFMINYRVENLEKLLKVLAEEGVEVVGEMQVYSYGKFGWIMDPEGNKIELWEPLGEKL